MIKVPAQMGAVPKKFWEKFTKLKPKYRYLIAVIVYMLVIGGFAGLSFFPKWGQIQTLKSDISAIEEKLQKTKSKAAKIEQIRAEHDKAEQELKRVSKTLPTSSEIPDLLKTMNRLGEECSLKFLLFVPEVPADKGDYFELLVNVEVKGMFHDVAKFLGLISAMDRLFVTHSLTISPQYQPAVVVTAKFKASTFWLKESTGEKSEKTDAQKK